MWSRFSLFFSSFDQVDKELQMLRGAGFVIKWEEKERRLFIAWRQSSHALHLADRSIVLLMVLSPKFPLSFFSGFGAVFPRIFTFCPLVVNGKLRSMCRDPVDELVRQKWSPVMTIAPAAIAIRTEFCATDGYGPVRCCNSGDVINTVVEREETLFAIEQPMEAKSSVDEVLRELMKPFKWRPALHLSFPMQCQHDILVWLIVSRFHCGMKIPKDIVHLIAQYLCEH
jgi:hypothetical protein